MKRDKKFFIGLLLLIAGAVASRWLPHPPNVTPLTAIALLGATYFPKRYYAYVLPLLILFISDLALGLHGTLPFVYGSFLAITTLGFWLRKRFHWGKLFGVTLLSSILFFLVTNFGVWLVGGFYPKTGQGLLLCYEAGLPFFRNTLLGDLIYTGVLFGVAELIQRFFVVGKWQVNSEKE